MNNDESDESGTFITRRELAEKSGLSDAGVNYHLDLLRNWLTAQDTITCNSAHSRTTRHSHSPLRCCCPDRKQDVLITW